MKLASISVDLDEVHRYSAIHGVDAPTGRARHAIYDQCLERFVDWFADEDVRATFFVVGEDLDRVKNRRAVAALHAAGHEVANHSYRHYYDLTRRPAAEVGEEIARGADAIEEACGKRPCGFRAPGYTVNDVVFSALDAQGVAYDSSVFPCPSYFAAKAATMAVLKLAGRRSASILDGPAVLRAPRDPYRVGRPYWQRGNGVLELPIGVTPTQLPYIGTSLVLGGERVSEGLTRQMLGRPLINLELHGMDLADATQDGLQSLHKQRPELRSSVDQRLGALRAALRVMRDADYELVTLEEAASRFSSPPSP